MSIPIVITAFGTTTAAREAYSRVEEHMKEVLADHSFYWAYSSRMVRDACRVGGGEACKGPREVLEDLDREGHPWAVVQSLHLVCGHEFYRLVEEAREARIRTSVGMPLLCSPQDYRRFMKALPETLPSPPDKDEAVVFVGHGTDHPSWVCYVALQHMFRQSMGARWLLGVVEGYPSREEVLVDVIQSGARKVRLVPLMLVAGRHVREDLLGAGDSWRAAFEREGIPAVVENRGLLSRSGVVDIFIDHIRDALDVIPD